MKSVIIASIAASAAAFSPSLTAPSAPATALNAFETELGSQPPLGFWDPLGLLDGADQARFDRLREVEIKHGRVAMLAFLGQVVTRAGIFLPGTIDKAGDAFSSFGVGWGALEGPDAIPQEGFSQILLFCGFLEGLVMKDIPGTGNEHIGDFRNGFIDYGWDKFSEEEKLFKRGVELNNGRAAMCGILGLMVHEQLGGEIPIVGKV